MENFFREKINIGIKLLFITAGSTMVLISTLLLYLMILDKTSTRNDIFLAIIIFCCGITSFFIPFIIKKIIKPFYKKHLEVKVKLFFCKIIKPIIVISKKIIITIIVVIILIFLGYKAYNFLWNNTHQISGWVFAGYDYRWSINYVENRGLPKELDCVSYGNQWIDRQSSEEAIFTCSSGCREDREFTEMLVCKKICEYEKTGLVRCRN